MTARSRGCSWSARTLTVLALLVGLLVMHGLSADHATMDHPLAVPGTAAAMVGNGDAMPGHQVVGAFHQRQRTTVLHNVGNEGLAAAMHTPAPGGGSMAALCLAILGAALALVLLAPAHRGRRAHHGGAPSAGRPTGRVLRWPPPPDLVAGLCVSRT